jgi:hypothetical protein
MQRSHIDPGAFEPVAWRPARPNEFSAIITFIHEIDPCFAQKIMFQLHEDK